MLRGLSISFMFSHISFVAVHYFCLGDIIARPSPAATFVYHLEKYKLFLLYAFFWVNPQRLIFRRRVITLKKAYNIQNMAKV
jgi:hypothetical protein